MRTIAGMEKSCSDGWSVPVANKPYPAPVRVSCCTLKNTFLNANQGSSVPQLSNHPSPFHGMPTIVKDCSSEGGLKSSLK